MRFPVNQNYIHSDYTLQTQVCYQNYDIWALQLFGGEQLCSIGWRGGRSFFAPLVQFLPHMCPVSAPNAQFLLKMTSFATLPFSSHGMTKSSWPASFKILDRKRRETKVKRVLQFLFYFIKTFCFNSSSLIFMASHLSRIPSHPSQFWKHTALSG